MPKLPKSATLIIIVLASSLVALATGASAATITIDFESFPALALNQRPLTLYGVKFTPIIAEGYYVFTAAGTSLLFDVDDASFGNRRAHGDRFSLDSLTIISTTGINDYSITSVSGGNLAEGLGIITVGADRANITSFSLFQNDSGFLGIDDVVLTAGAGAISGRPDFPAPSGPVGSGPGASGPAESTDAAGSVGTPSLGCVVSIHCDILGGFGEISKLASAPISSGAFMPDAVAVPEPTCLALLGTALFCLGWLRQRRHARQIPLAV